MCRKRVSASQGVIFCIFIFLLLVLNRISDDGRLSWENLEKLYIYSGIKPKDCWVDQSIGFMKISSDGLPGAGSSASRIYEVCLSNKGLFLQTTNDLNFLYKDSPILIPWHDIYLRIEDDAFPLQFSLNKISLSRIAISPETPKICREMLRIIKDKVENKDRLNNFCGT